MGKRMIQVSMATSVSAVIVSIVCCFLPFHKKAYSTLGILPVFMVDTYPLTVTVRFTCGVIRNPQWCLDLSTPHDLETVSQRFCAPVIHQMFPNLCPGLRNAWFTGISTALAVFTNAVLSLVSVFLMYQYMAGTPKAQLRKVALILLCIGTLLVVSCLVIYIPMVFMFLEDTKCLIPGGSMVIAGSAAVGVAPGYIFMWICMIWQLGVIALSKFAKTSEEAAYAEAKEHEKFMADINMYNQAATGMGAPSSQMPGGQAHDGFNAPGVGQPQQPQQQQQPGGWGATPQAQGQWGQQPQQQQPGGWGQSQQAGW